MKIQAGNFVPAGGLEPGVVGIRAYRRGCGGSQIMDLCTDPYGEPESPMRAGQRRRATLTVAAAARDVAECATLLDMLGLTPMDGLVLPTVPVPATESCPELVGAVAAPATRSNRQPLAAASQSAMGRWARRSQPALEHCSGWSDFSGPCPG